MAAIRRGELFNQSAPGANTDIFSSDITPKKNVTRARIEIATAGGGPVNVTATDGTTTHTWSLGGGVSTSAEALTSYEISVSQSLAYNVQIEWNSVVETLIWDDLIERA
jgi:hypothetical protein